MNHFLRVAGGDVPLSLRLSFLLVATLATRAYPQTLIDDFSVVGPDGFSPPGWTTFDSTIGQSYGPGTFDASSGAYHLEGGGLVPHPFAGSGDLFSVWDQSSEPKYSNGLLRARVRAETEGTLAYLLFRASNDGATRACSGGAAGPVR